MTTEESRTGNVDVELEMHDYSHYGDLVNPPEIIENEN